MRDTTNAALGMRREAAVPRSIGNAFPLYVARAENAELWDVEGRRYIDFAGGIAVLNTGHRNGEVMQRVAAQAGAFTHTCFQVLPYESYIALAERLNAIAPVQGPAKTALFSTGAEAVENAVKIARYATGRPAIISFTGAFHGRTLMTLALTGKVKPYKAGFGPMPPDVFHAPYPSAAEGIDTQHSIDALLRLFNATVDPKRVAAIIVEPVQGEGGFHITPAELLRALRALSDEHGILLIADEIQTGFARTGRMFALEHSGVRADLVTMAKSLAGGFPLSAVTGRAAIMDSVDVGGLGSTYAGNPLSCAAALGVLDVIEKQGLCARAATLGERLVTRLRELRQSVRCIADIRSLGSMVALELGEDGDLRRPAPALAKAVVAEASRNDLLLLTCGQHGNILRFLYPLTIQDHVFSEALEILSHSIASVSRAAA